MDGNRALIAFGMLMALIAFALQKQTIDGNAVEKIVTFLAGGITGAMNPMANRGGDPKAGARAAAALLLIFGVLMLHGCATTEPYKGPLGPPTLTGDEWYWPHGIDQRWTRETVLHVNNSTPSQLDAVLDCDSAFRHQRKWPGSRITLHVPPMTVQHVLIDPHDHVCSLLPLEAE